MNHPAARGRDILFLLAGLHVDSSFVCQVEVEKLCRDELEGGIGFCKVYGRPGQRSLWMLSEGRGGTEPGDGGCWWFGGRCVAGSVHDGREGV